MFNILILADLRKLEKDIDRKMAQFEIPEGKSLEKEIMGRFSTD